ncbi:MAG: tyrosine--tRNA ligase [Sphaerobacteraceae bacterium]|nr:MAG: tyrosine--tRNA ligase [Sphaerobacteraceae bacterium]
MVLTGEQREAAIQHLMSRGVAEIIVREDLEKKLRGDKQLRIKLGVDPTRPDIHLGHYVAFRKLRQFQRLGHKVVIIIGDWTARIGDPSGRSVQRQMMTEEEVRYNAQTYLDQLSKVVDVDEAEVVWQTEWFSAFTLEDVIRLTAKYTVAQMLTREDFHNRYESGSPIAVTELLYPLLQAYDSVAIRSDVEMGGTDQTFNLLVGRDIQKESGQEPQNIFTVPILVGTDGHQKMSKSLDNYIAVNDAPQDMYGKIMSIPDGPMIEYYRLLTDVSDEEIEQMQSDSASGAVNPRDLKARLARIIVADLHSEEDATKAEQAFDSVYRQNQLPDEMPEFAYVPGTGILSVLTGSGVASSNRDARRLIEQGGIRVNGERVTDPESTIANVGEVVLQAGRRRFVRLVPAS